MNFWGLVTVVSNRDSSEGGMAHEKRIKIAVLDKQAKTGQNQPKYL